MRARCSVHVESIVMLADAISNFLILYLPWFGLAVGTILLFLCGVRRLRSSRLIMSGTILMLVSGIILLMQITK